MPLLPLAADGFHFIDRSRVCREMGRVSACDVLRHASNEEGIRCGRSVKGCQVFCIEHERQHHTHASIFLVSSVSSLLSHPTHKLNPHEPPPPTEKKNKSVRNMSRLKVLYIHKYSTHDLQNVKSRPCQCCYVSRSVS